MGVGVPCTADPENGWMQDADHLGFPGGPLQGRAQSMDVPGGGRPLQEEVDAGPADAHVCLAQAVLATSQHRVTLPRESRHLRCPAQTTALVSGTAFCARTGFASIEATASSPEAVLAPHEGNPV